MLYLFVVANFTNFAHTFINSFLLTFLLPEGSFNVGLLSTNFLGFGHAKTSLFHPYSWKSYFSLSPLKILPFLCLRASAAAAEILPSHWQFFPYRRSCSTSLPGSKVFLSSLQFCSFTSKHQSADFFPFILIIHNIFPVSVDCHLSWILDNYSNITSPVFSPQCSSETIIRFMSPFLILSPTSINLSLSGNFHFPVSLCGILRNFFCLPVLLLSASNLSHHQIFFHLTPSIEGFVCFYFYYFNSYKIHF